MTIKGNNDNKTLVYLLKRGGWTE